jgi:hypothetical protein
MSDDGAESRHDADDDRVGDGVGGGVLEPVISMITALPGSALAEMEHALSLLLHPAPSAANRRVAELGYLASLLEEQKPFPVTRPELSIRGRRQARRARPPRLERSEYERRQPQEEPTAPSATRLVEAHGSWAVACRHAYGLQSDGRHRSGTNAWAQPLKGKSMPRYTLDDVRAAIRRCAKELGRLPSAGDYHAWARDAKRRARERGVQLSGANPSEHPLIPGIKTIYRLFPKKGIEANRWRAALADVGLTEVEVAEGRMNALGILDPTDPTMKKMKRRSTTTSMKIGISAAITQAQKEGVSLDFLAGRSVVEGEPPPTGSRFDPERLLVVRDRRQVSDAHLREAIKLQLGPWKRLLKGQIEPTLGQVATLAAAVGTPISGLVEGEGK